MKMEVKVRIKVEMERKVKWKLSIKINENEGIYLSKSHGKNRNSICNYAIDVCTTPQHLFISSRYLF